MDSKDSTASFASALSDVLLKASDQSKIDGPNAIGGKILGLYFSAHWCPPCKSFTPMLVQFYQELRRTRQDFEIVFISSDRSEEEYRHYASTMPWLCLDYGRRDLKGALGEAFRVTGIPTLVWLNKDGTPITLEGRKKVVEDPKGAQFPWLDAAPPAFAAPANANTAIWADLSSNIDKAKLYATNGDSDTSVGSLFDASKPGLLRSDADEQLLISIPFNQACKIHSFRVVGSVKAAPKKIKLFVNTLNIGFDDAERLKATQEVTLSAAQATDAKSTVINTNFVAFQRVTNLTFFIENNQQDEDATEVTHIDLIGSLAH